MRWQIPLRTGAAISLSLVCCMHNSAAQSPVVASSKVIIGTIQVPEVSGAAFLPGDRLLVVADEGETVLLLNQATERLKTGTVKKTDFQPLAMDGKLKGIDGKPRELDDLEDVAWDRQSNVFLVTSHSVNRTGKGRDEKPERYAIVRLTFGADGVTVDKAAVFDLMVPPKLQEAMKRTSAQSGFNIEGAAWNQEGHLLLGLRSPTETFGKSRKPDSNEDAVVLEVKDPSANPLKAEVKASLNLKGSGIRGMCYDPEEHGLWLLAGLSPDPPDGMVQAKWFLWFLPDGGTPELRELPQETATFANAEAVARVSIGETPHLLLVEDGPEVSRYVLFPVPKK